MVIYAIAIINMCVFAHAFSRSGVPGHRSSGSDFIPCSSQGKDQPGSEICKFVQHCSNLRAWVNSSWLSRPLAWELLWGNTSPQHWDFQQQALYNPLHSLSGSQSLFCAQLLTLNVEPAKWDLREKPRMWLNTFPWNSLQRRHRSRYSSHSCLLFCFLSTVTFLNYQNKHKSAFSPSPR